MGFFDLFRSKKKCKCYTELMCGVSLHLENANISFVSDKECIEVYVGDELVGEMNKREMKSFRRSLKKFEMR
jgi:hypothetical protein